MTTILIKTQRIKITILLKALDEFIAAVITLHSNKSRYNSCRWMYQFLSFCLLLPKALHKRKSPFSTYCNSLYLQHQRIYIYTYTYACPHYGSAFLVSGLPARIWSVNSKVFFSTRKCNIAKWRGASSWPRCARFDVRCVDGS